MVPSSNSTSYIFNEVLQTDLKYVNFDPFVPQPNQPLQRIVASVIQSDDKKAYLLSTAIRDHRNIKSLCHKRIDETVHHWQALNSLVLWSCKENADLFERDESFVVFVDILAKNVPDAIIHTKAVLKMLNVTMVEGEDPNYIFKWPLDPEEKRLIEQRLSCSEDQMLPLKIKENIIKNIVLGVFLLTTFIIFPVALLVSSKMGNR